MKTREIKSSGFLMFIDCNVTMPLKRATFFNKLVFVYKKRRVGLGAQSDCNPDVNASLVRFQDAAPSRYSVSGSTIGFHPISVGSNPTICSKLFLRVSVKVTRWAHNPSQTVRVSHPQPNVSNVAQLEEAGNCSSMTCISDVHVGRTSS